MVLLRLLAGDEGNHAKVTPKGFHQILLPPKVALCHHIHVWWRADQGWIIQRLIKCDERWQPLTMPLSILPDKGERCVLAVFCCVRCIGVGGGDATGIAMVVSIFCSLRPWSCRRGLHMGCIVMKITSTSTSNYITTPVFITLRRGCQYACSARFKEVDLSPSSWLVHTTGHSRDRARAECEF